MGDFRSFKTARREPAAPLQPVVDPADWKPEALKDVDNWSYRLTERDGDELAAARRGRAQEPVSPWSTSGRTTSRSRASAT